MSGKCACTRDGSFDCPVHGPRGDVSRRFRLVDRVIEDDPPLDCVGDAGIVLEHQEALFRRPEQTRCPSCGLLRGQHTPDCVEFKR